LLAENKALKEENQALKIRLGLAEHPESRPSPEGTRRDASLEYPFFHLDNKADPTEKIRLFMSLFRGRDDLYAKRWESKDGTRHGYTPACLNEGELGLCRKFSIKCASCSHISEKGLTNPG
jgi:hypothetical protein